MNIPQHISKEFLADIFGCQIGTHFEAGLADAKSESLFTKGLQKVQAKWNNLEKSCNPSGTPPKFFEWFVQYKADEIKKCVLPDIRKKAGIDGSSFFTTNNSESLNHIIKQEVQWKETMLPQLIESFKLIALDQVHLTEKQWLSGWSRGLALFYSENLNQPKSYGFHE